MMIVQNFCIAATLLTSASSLAMLFPSPPARAEEALRLEGKIALGDVQGRLDHFAVDLGRRRLFVAQLGDNSVAVIDLDQSKVTRVIRQLNQPQGLAHVAGTDTLFVANGGDGVVQRFQGEEPVTGRPD